MTTEMVTVAYSDGTVAEEELRIWDKMRFSTAMVKLGTRLNIMSRDRKVVGIAAPSHPQYLWVGWHGDGNLFHEMTGGRFK